MTVIVYGEGGFDPDRPNSNIVEIVKGDAVAVEDDPVVAVVKALVASPSIDQKTKAALTDAMDGANAVTANARVV